MKTTPWKELRQESADSDPGFEAGVAEARTETVREIMAHNLSEMRKARNVTQVELAHSLGINQPGVSRIEKTDDVRLSTLRRYLEALGARLEICAVFDDQRMVLA